MHLHREDRDPAATSRKRKHSRPFLAVSAIGLVLFSAAGMGVALVRISDARYLEFSMYNAALLLARSILSHYLSVLLPLLIFILLLHLVLSRSSTLEAHDEFAWIVEAVLFVFVFLAGGFYLNRADIFPPFVTREGLLSNALYTLSIVLLGTVLFLLRRPIVALLSPLRTPSRKVYVVTVLMGAIVLSVYLLVFIRKNADERGRPSILLISIDTTRKDHLGCYGYDLPVSPSLDEFSKDAVLFRRAVSTAPWTLPSHMSLFTSQYTLEHGMGTGVLKVDTGVKGPLLAEVLKDHFFTTLAFTGGGWLNHQFGFSRGFDMYRDRNVNPRVPVPEDVVPIIRKNSGSPFFLFLHTYCLHDYYSPPSYRTSKGAACDERFDEWEEIRPLLVLYKHTPLVSERGKEDLKCCIRAYDASVRFVDHELGRFFAELKKMGIYDDLMIVVTSDHGEEFGEHRHTYHGHSLYNELIRIPLIIKFPHGEYGGQVVENLVRQVDIVPTILDYLGIPSQPWMRGKSMMPILRGNPAAPRSAFSEAVNERVLKFSLRTREHHLIYETLTDNWRKGMKGYFRLYDLASDPGEMEDVSRAEPAVYDSLKRELTSEYSRMASRGFGKIEKVDLNRDTEEWLKAMGYIQ